jgi:hypothetical protein
LEPILGYFGKPIHLSKIKRQPDCLKGGQMVITSTLSYPTESANEIGKRFKDLPPQPSFITWKGPYIRSEVGLGFKVFSIYEFDQSKMAEVLESIGNRMANFIGVPGFTYSLDVWLEAKEGLKLIGMG